MINEYKSNPNLTAPQIAGLFPGDNRIEFYGNVQTKEPSFFRNGKIHCFTNLPSEVYHKIKEKYYQDSKAVAFLSKIVEEEKDQISLFTYFMWGGLDDTPDYENGKLSEAENFLDSENCPSLLWLSKNLTIGRYIVTPRDRVMIKLMADGLIDAVIADKINVCHSHFDTLKRNLFKHTQTNNKTSLVLKAKSENVI